MRTTPSPAPVPTSAPSLDTARAHVIDLLSAHFAHDGITVEELDERLDRAHQASSFPELEALVQDVPRAAGALARISATFPAYQEDPFKEPAGEESERILAVMSQMRRSGLWVVPRRLDVTSVLSETVLDLRQASLLPGVTYVALDAVMTQVTIIVPASVRVVNRIVAFMGVARDRTAEEPEPGRGAAVLRVDGWAVMAEVTIRRNEEKK